MDPGLRRDLVCSIVKRGADEALLSPGTTIWEASPDDREFAGAGQPMPLTDAASAPSFRAMIETAPRLERRRRRLSGGARAHCARAAGRMGLSQPH